MPWRFLVAQTLAMVFLAVAVLSLRDLIRHRSDSEIVRRHLFLIAITLALMAWSIWLIVREVKLIKP